MFVRLVSHALNGKTLIYKSENNDHFSIFLYKHTLPFENMIIIHVRSPEKYDIHIYPIYSSTVVAVVFVTNEQYKLNHTVQLLLDLA